MGEWRNVPGYEGLYQINIAIPEGRCRRLLKNGKVKELSNRPNQRDGRIVWALYKDGKSCKWQAARWIALTYPELVQNEFFEGAEIDHIDTDRLNNHPSNLRWVDDYGQMNNSLTKQHRSKKMLNRKDLSKWVIKLSHNNDILHFYPSISQAAKDNNIPFSCISRCCSKKTKTAGGFIWKYAE